MTLFEQVAEALASIQVQPSLDMRDAYSSAYWKAYQP